MDLRQKKTKKSIANAFLVLRSKKALERITVKELSELAEISKATFYLHYRDVYHLSCEMQDEVIQKILSDIEHPQYFVTDNRQFTQELFRSFYAQKSLIDTLFSGEQALLLPEKIENGLKAYFEDIPHKSDKEFNIMLSFAIYGACSTYSKYKKQCDIQQLTLLVSKLSNAVMQTN